ncbi:MAG: hypothetical protein HYZ14_05325 [Bacteroidetes bacterium]|nr:hypothetical protein [Bacteroidota bacterium]
MNQILKIFFDEPEKAERMFLFILRTLIIAALLSIFIYGPIGNKIFPQEVCDSAKAGSFWDLSFLKNASFMDAATYVTLFVITWLLFWGVIIDLVIHIVVSILNKLLGWTFFALGFLIKLVIFSGWWYLYSLGAVKKPIKFWIWGRQVQFDEEFEDGYDRRIVRIQSNLALIKKISRLMGKAPIEEILIFILEHEKVHFIRSRVSQYFSIVFVVCVVHLYKFKIQDYGAIEISMCIGLFLLGSAILSINQVYSTLLIGNTTDLIKARLIQEAHVAMIQESLENSSLTSRYKVKQIKRLVIALNLKDKFNGWSDYIKDVRFFSFGERPENIYNWLKQRYKPINDCLLIIVCSEAPDIVTQNLMVDRNVGFIQASDEDEMLSALDKIQPIILGRISV